MAQTRPLVIFSMLATITPPRGHGPRYSTWTYQVICREHMYINPLRGVGRISFEQAIAAGAKHWNDAHVDQEKKGTPAR